jgi:hypothetical protein
VSGETSIFGDAADQRSRAAVCPATATGPEAILGRTAKPEIRCLAEMESEAADRPASTAQVMSSGSNLGDVGIGHAEMCSSKGMRWARRTLLR